MNESQSGGTETDNNEGTKTPSDARIILGPLVKYAGIGLVMVAILITTVVTLDRQFNDIDREVAELEAQLASAHPAADSDQTAVNDNALETDAVDETLAEQAAEPEPALSPAVEVSTNQVTSTDADNKTPEAAAVADVSVAGTTVRLASNEAVDQAVSADQTAVVEQVNQNIDSVARPDDFFDKSIEDLIKERNAYLNERDKAYLEEFKASQEKQLQLMRERLARQEQRIEAMEKRNQERYETRAADVMEMQQRRENFLSDRI
jgi:BMFP domain-containing protein YqiC